MSDLRDPAIKLFGRTIPLEEPDKDACEITNPEQSTEPNSDHSLDPVHGEPNSDQSLGPVHGELNSDQSLDPVHGEPNKPETEPDSKTLKKPDKILPCPRCNSMETKFCYYNNYNVNQPRHFCKKCQRYWTAGGTMRNVPVGAGRRKNKHLNRPQLFGTDVSEPVPVPPNGSVVKFGTGTDMPLCESMVSGLTIKENRSGTSTGTGTCTGTVSSEENITAVPVPPVQFYPGAPFVYPWNTGTIPVPVPVQPATGFCPPTVPFPFVPASFWAFGWGPPQWVGSPASSSTSTCSTSTGSPTLGKHSRDGTGTVPEQSEKNLWVPKTLRIDDPEEAAKSSIWDTLGIKPEERGVLGAFRGKNGVRGPVRSLTSQVLHANPAALSRSQSFQESS